MTAGNRDSNANAILRVVVPYAVFASLWILLSDRLLAGLGFDAAAFVLFSIFKGCAFVLVTSVLLACLVYRDVKGRCRVDEELRRLHEELQHHAVELRERVEARTREVVETTSFLNALVDHISNPIFYKDANARFRGCNSAYEKAFAISRNAIIGKTVLDLDYLPMADREVYQAEDTDMIANGRTLNREAVIPFADGREHQTLYSVSGFRAPDGSPGGLVGIIVDVTPLKETEAALRDAKHAAESADRLKSAFLATMSHELRTPLNSIIGFTGIVLQGLAGPLTEEQRKQLGMVQGSARHLLALINDVLDISKIAAGELRVSCAVFDLRALLERVVTALRPMAAMKRLTLQAQIDPEIGDMTSDGRRVEQILLNLLNNAVKFTERGEVKLCAKSEDGLLRVAVSDTGVGIKSEDIAILFQPFRQIDTGLARNHEGTGLGLAISRRLAELLGGDIRVASDWGKGTVFTVTLPLAMTQTTAPNLAVHT